MEESINKNCFGSGSYFCAGGSRFFVGSLFVFFMALLMLGGTGCVRTSSENEYVRAPYPDPVVLDYDAIMQRGTIRMITRYNSTSYFLHRGNDRGFEYELVSRFADEHDLKVEVVLLRPEDDPIEMLLRGEGDLIVGNYAITPERRRHVGFTHPYNIVNQVLVQSESARPIAGLSDLEQVEITVRRNSSYYQKLREFSGKGLDLSVHIADEDWNTEALMLEVANGNIEATVADDNLFMMASNYIEGIAAHKVIAEADTVAWAIRPNAPLLKEHMDRFLQEHFRIRASDGRILRSAFLNILQRRYFDDERQVRRLTDPSMNMALSGFISPYDDLVRDIAEEAELDWKLVLAVMAQESQFNPNARSWAGAVGLMQIIPRFSEVEEEALLFDPEINIREGVRYLRDHLDRYAHLDSLNRYSMALATYNVGMGHMADARRLAIQLGNDPDEWESIADALLRLMNHKYYQHARYGFKRGIETVNYVESVLDRYQTFHSVAELAVRYEESGIISVWMP